MVFALPPRAIFPPPLWLGRLLAMKQAEQGRYAIIVQIYLKIPIEQQKIVKTILLKFGYADYAEFAYFVINQNVQVVLIAAINEFFD